MEKEENKTTPESSVPPSETPKTEDQPKKEINPKSIDALIRYVETTCIKDKGFPEFGSGDSVTVYYKISDKTKDGKVKERIQFFKGTVIQVRGKGATKMFTVRKISHNVAVERIFPMNMPGLEKIEIHKYGKVRRARLFYFRELSGKKARIKEDLSKRNKALKKRAGK